MATHFDHELDILQPAAQRYLERTGAREEQRRKIEAGRASEAEAPERVRMRLERLSRAAVQEAVHARQAQAADGTRGSRSTPALVETIGFERVIGRRDFQGMDFLEMALAVSRFVCRVQVKSGPASVEGYGTGFMVSPRLMLTNHHVLGSAAAARWSLAEFDYQKDRYGSLLPVVTFELAPQDFFATSQSLDYALVAVRPVSRSGVPLTRFAWTRLIKSQGKAILGDPLNIIQHPRGETKQVVLRSNTLIDLLALHAHYETDTEPGSSGSPVFNDQWELVALHHSAVPAKEGDSLIATDGSAWKPAMGPERLRWVANEGVRVSSLVQAIEELRFDDPAHGRLRDALLSEEPPHPLEVAAGRTGAPAPEPRPEPGGTTTWTIPLQVTVQLGAPALAASPVLVAGAPSAARPVQADVDTVRDTALGRDGGLAEEAISIDPDYATRTGYTPEFLGQGEKNVRLPEMPAALRKHAAVNQRAAPQADQHRLDYHHFSLVMHRLRRLAIFTAVNIDGRSHKSPARETDRWFYDPRIERSEQMGNEVYASNPLDRGHLVRRLDPAWGSSAQVAKVANDDTFHWTNCSPQEERFNQGARLWAGLEDYILENAVTADQKVSVFTGPVFRKTDPRYRGIQIPLEFWKVAVIVKTGGKLSATAYLVSQENQIGELPEEEAFVYGAYRTFQVPVKRIEKLTGLSFGKLSKHDPLAAAPDADEVALEAGKAGVREIGTPGDIRL